MFAELGYDAATLEEIAADAGFTKGAMQFHFPTKDALFVELLDNELRRHVAEIGALIALAADSPETINSELRQWLDRNDEGPDLGSPRPRGAVCRASERSRSCAAGRRRHQLPAGAIRIPRTYFK